MNSHSEPRKPVPPICSMSVHKIPNSPSQSRRPPVPSKPPVIKPPVALVKPLRNPVAVVEIIKEPSKDLKCIAPKPTPKPRSNSNTLDIGLTDRVRSNTSSSTDSTTDAALKPVPQKRTSIETPPRTASQISDIDELIVEDDIILKQLDGPIIDLVSSVTEPVNDKVDNIGAVNNKDCVDDSPAALPRRHKSTMSSAVNTKNDLNSQKNAKEAHIKQVHSGDSNSPKVAKKALSPPRPAPPKKLVNNTDAKSSDKLKSPRKPVPPGLPRSAAGSPGVVQKSSSPHPVAMPAPVPSPARHPIGMPPPVPSKPPIGSPRAMSKQSVTTTAHTRCMTKQSSNKNEAILKCSMKLKPCVSPKPVLRRSNSIDHLNDERTNNTPKKELRRSRSESSLLSDIQNMEHMSDNRETDTFQVIDEVVKEDLGKSIEESSVSSDVKNNADDAVQVTQQVIDININEEEILHASKSKPEVSLSADIPKPRPRTRSVDQTGKPLQAPEQESVPSTPSIDETNNKQEIKPKKFTPVRKAPPPPVGQKNIEGQKVAKVLPTISSNKSIEQDSKCDNHVDKDSSIPCIQDKTDKVCNNEQVVEMASKAGSTKKKKKRWSRRRGSRSSTKSSSSTSINSDKYDSDGYMKPRTMSDVSRTSWYVDMDEEDMHRYKTRSNSDSAHKYESISYPSDNEECFTPNTPQIDDTYAPSPTWPDNTLVSPTEPASNVGQVQDMRSPVVPPRTKRNVKISEVNEVKTSEAEVEGELDDDYIYPEDVMSPELRAKAASHRETQQSGAAKNVFQFPDIAKQSDETEDNYTYIEEGSSDTSSEKRHHEYHDMSGVSFSPGPRGASNLSISDKQYYDSSGSEDESEASQSLKKKRKIYRIVEEIMASEQVFVDVLRLLNQDFRKSIDEKTSELDRPVIPAKEMNQILNYLPQLQNFNEELLKDITERVEHWDEHQRVADIFVKKGPFLKLYTSYIKGFESTMKSLDEACKRHPLFSETMREFEMSEQCANLNIKAYMLKPIQRIPQYKLLLQDYQKNLTEEHQDYEDTKTALAIVSEVASHANETMRQDENFKKLLEIQNVLVGQFEVVKPGRVLLKQGELQKLSRKVMQPRYFFLFSDVMLYTTPIQKDVYKINNVLSFSGMKVSKPSQEDFQHEFSIISVQRSFTLSASTSQERDDWLNSLKMALEESHHKKKTFDTVSEKVVQGKDFVLGSTAPVWIPDARVTMCMTCTSEFTVTWRRHHCRACGKVVCANCSQNKAPLKYMDNKSSRVCEECYETLETEYKERGDTISVLSGDSDKSTSKSSIRNKFRNFRKSVVVRRPSVLREVTANDQGFDMSGYLKVFKDKNKKWKKLWFVLKEKVLYTYKASEDMAAIESAPLLGYSIETFDQWFEGVEANLVFQISHKGRPSTVFRTESSAAVEKWIAAMREATVP